MTSASGSVSDALALLTKGTVTCHKLDQLEAKLKEGRPLVLVVRETPLHLGHLRLLTALAEMGAVILPPMPAFYNRQVGS